MALLVVLGLVLGPQLALADEDPGHGKRLKEPNSSLTNLEEQAWIDAQLLKTNYYRDDPTGLVLTVDLLKQNGGLGRLQAAVKTLNGFNISADDVWRRMNRPRHLHPDSKARDITVPLKRASNKRTESTPQTHVLQNKNLQSGQQTSLNQSRTVAASHANMVKRIRRLKVASASRKPAATSTEHAAKPGNTTEISHAVPKGQSAAQGHQEHKDDHKETVQSPRKQMERQAALKEQKEHEDQVKALRASHNISSEANRSASALEKLDHSKNKSIPGEITGIDNFGTAGKQSWQDALELEKDYLAGNAESMKKLMKFMLDHDGSPRVESAFSELQRLGYDVIKVQAWMDHPRDTHPQTLDHIFARKAKLSVKTQETSPVKEQPRKDEDKQSLPFLREKSFEPAVGNSNDVAEPAGKQAEIDAHFLEGDIIGSDLSGMKDVMRLILHEGGQQRMRAAVAALESQGYDSVAVESWLAGKKGPPAKEQKATLEERHAGKHASNREESKEKDYSAGSVQQLKEATLDAEHAVDDANSKETRASKHDIVASKQDAKQPSEAEQADQDANRLETHIGKHDRAALKQVMRQLLSEGGQERIEHAILKLQEKGYSHDELLQELFTTHRAKHDATEAAFLQMPGSVTRKALRSAK
eukprot:TRINITY_DN26888_c0_g1_i1.p1 TRINITY_DN26888_c0_g1~~TRINITY_DN26888_c0_g1_i1.p1  ORF type:complete len:644 (-),score=163.07 TRINITY_DN26888_c0_g1_i1:32-1963(-)